MKLNYSSAKHTLKHNCRESAESALEIGKLGGRLECQLLEGGGRQNHDLT